MLFSYLKLSPVKMWFAFSAVLNSALTLSAAAQSFVVESDAACLNNGGEPVPSLNRSGQDLGLCRFGQAWISSVYLQDLQSGFFPKPVLQFLNRHDSQTESISNAAETCRRSNGSWEELSAPIGHSLLFCRFDERGGISQMTFHLGADAPENAALHEALDQMIPQAQGHL